MIELKTIRSIDGTKTATLYQVETGSLLPYKVTIEGDVGMVTQFFLTSELAEDYIKGRLGSAQFLNEAA